MIYFICERGFTPMFYDCLHLNSDYTCISVRAKYSRTDAKQHAPLLKLSFSTWIFNFNLGVAYLLFTNHVKLISVQYTYGSRPKITRVYYSYNIIHYLGLFSFQNKKVNYVIQFMKSKLIIAKTFNDIYLTADLSISLDFERLVNSIDLHMFM